MSKFQSIKKLTVLILIITAFTSCSNEITLQTYFVDNELKPGFSTFDIPKSLLNIENIELTAQQQKAYKSLNKLNVLAFRINDKNRELYDTELQNVKTIFKDSKYQELIRGGNTTDGKFVIKFLGDIDNIDELIILGNSNDNGFAVVRVLGNDMNANDLISLRNVMDKINTEDINLKSLTDFLK